MQARPRGRRRLSTQLIEDLHQATAYLTALRFQKLRRTTKAKAVAINFQTSTRVGNVRCTAARALVDSLGRGAGKPNHVVYWLIPPPGRVEYVGRSRALDSRCSGHTPYRRQNLMTLNLPPLTYSEARSVEEALIAHFGLDNRSDMHRITGANGQLRNTRHEIDPLKADYCEHLLLGQYILTLNQYAAYAAAYFTKGTVCPGVGGPA